MVLSIRMRELLKATHITLLSVPSTEERRRGADGAAPQVTPLSPTLSPAGERETG